jgi:hypothetical protein
LPTRVNDEKVLDRDLGYFLNFSPHMMSLSRAVSTMPILQQSWISSTKQPYTSRYVAVNFSLQRALSASLVHPLMFPGICKTFLCLTGLPPP